MRRFSLCLALLACACAGSPAPVAYGGSGDARGQQEERQRAATPAPNWAAGEGTPLSAYALRPEDVQPHDPARTPRTHRVSAGEGIYEIATAYQIPLLSLIEQNRLEPPYALAPGRTITLPPPRFHVVARGERFEDIAQRYSVDTRSLALLNRMSAPYAVRAGDRIVLPAMASDTRPDDPPAPPVVVAPAAQARFAWPLRGEIVARFGPQAGGQRLDGVEIAGRIGAPIVAAADGDVVYAGNDLPGYGFLVIIRHTENYVTAYGYTQRALVREGQRVRAGERIAELGEHPGGGARLLFQVRQGSSAVDPAPLLGGG